MPDQLDLDKLEAINYLMEKPTRAHLAVVALLHNKPDLASAISRTVTPEEVELQTLESVVRTLEHLKDTHEKSK